MKPLQKPLRPIAPEENSEWKYKYTRDQRIQAGVLHPDGTPAPDTTGLSKEALKLLPDDIDGQARCLELMDYKDFVFYTVVTAMVTQERKVIRKEVVHSPDILAVIRDVPFLRQYLESFYNCDYKTFFEAFIEIIVAI